MEVPEMGDLSILECNINNMLEYIIQLKELESTDCAKWLKQMCLNFGEVIQVMGCFIRNLDHQAKQYYLDTFLFHLTQLLSSITFLSMVFTKELQCGQQVQEARKCACNRLNLCLDLLKEALQSSKQLVNSSGCFINWMDNALDKIAEVNMESGKEYALQSCREVRHLFEEVLAHAMSLAQVSLKQDYKIIKGGSQTVLNSLEALTNELSKDVPNAAMVNLFVDTCSDKLCALERKVDIAVLKLCLSLFSEFITPLEKIHKFVFEEKYSYEQQAFDNLVADFDLHVDRIMQVGLFAVSCSTDAKSGIDIRNCLANLESLECELIPALTVLLKDNAENNIICALLYKDYWIKEVTLLKKLIFHIIDPFAFCQVVSEEISFEINNMKKIEKVQQNLSNDSLQNVIKYGKVLKEFTYVVMEETPITNDTSNSLMAQRKICDRVLNEIECANELLTENTAENRTKISKRCKIFRNEVKKLWLCFSDNHTDEVKEESERKLKVENLSLKTGCVSTEDNPFLIHILKRGQKLLEDRSILYRTPKRSDNLLANLKPFRTKVKGTPKYIDSRKVSFSSYLCRKEDPLDLQLTDISKDLSNISETMC